MVPAHLPPRHDAMPAGPGVIHQVWSEPINGRRVDSFVLLTPGVTNDGTFGLLSFRGVAGHNAFLIDGNDTILTRSSLQEMFTPQIRAVDGEGGSGEDVQAGLSCFIERHGGI